MSPPKRSLVTSLRRFVFGYDDDEATAVPRMLSWRSSKWFIILTVVLGIFVDIFLYGSTVVVLPFVLESQAGVAHEDIGKWTGYSMLSYALASLVSSPVAGFLADKAKNRRGPLLLGLAFLLTGCVCLWAANNLVVLIIGRVLQGVSAGFVWSIGLALIADTVGFDEVGEILAYADISLCFGLASSPPIAGSLLKLAGKNAVYGLILGMIILDVFMRLFLIERKTAMRFDPFSPASSEEDESNEESKAQELAAITSQPNEPDSYLKYALVLFKSWRVVGALIGTWASSHILITIDVVVPVYCEERYGWGSLMVGLLLLTFYAPCLLCILTGRIADKHGHDGRWLAIGGFLGCIPCFLGLTAVEMIPGDFPVLFWILMPCAGTALAVANTPIMAEIIYTLMSKQDNYPILRRNSGGYGLAYGIFMTVFSLGSATASAVSPLLLQMDHGWNIVMYSLAAVCLAVTVPVAVWSGRKAPHGRLGMRKPREELRPTE